MGEMDFWAAIFVGLFMATTNFLRWLDTRKDSKQGHYTREALIREIQTMTYEVRKLTESFDKHEENTEDVRASLKLIGTKYEVIKAMGEALCNSKNQDSPT